MRADTRVFAERRDYGNCIDIHILDEAGDTISVAQPVVFKTQEAGTMTAPCLRLQTQVAQRLMDELWRAGLRPTEGSGSAGSLAATERHLADMKQIAFHALKVKP